DLQQALELVSYGDTIWVAQGIYRPTLTPDRSISFVIPNGVSILGGFNGSEIEAIQRNWEVSPTTLSGDIGVQGDSLDNSYHVIRIFGADSTTLIDGFVITHGYAFKENDFGEANHGAGAYIGVNVNMAVSTPKFIN
ncbi:MAG: hypothetical protein HUU34_22920, partial [Saprospiraceae bacterium]|nr:hypothetical protein [Saprospiraceae bacterium]